MHRVVLSVFLILLVTSARADDDRPRAAADPLAACQLTLARASRQLGDGIRRQVGKCIAAGFHCLTAADVDPTTCCAALATRCTAEGEKLARVRARFAGAVRVGRCASVPFAAVVDAEGLGFERAGRACACLTPPVAVVDLL